MFSPGPPGNETPTDMIVSQSEWALQEVTPYTVPRGHNTVRVVSWEMNTFYGDCIIF